MHGGSALGSDLERRARAILGDSLIGRIVECVRGAVYEHSLRDGLYDFVGAKWRVKSANAEDTDEEAAGNTHLANRGENSVGRRSGGAFVGAYWW